VTGPYKWSFDTLWLANQTLESLALIGTPLICDRTTRATDIVGEENDLVV
jgi:hypothetical protein